MSKKRGGQNAEAPLGLVAGGGLRELWGPRRDQAQPPPPAHASRYELDQEDKLALSELEVATKKVMMRGDYFRPQKVSRWSHEISFGRDPMAAVK
jgi:hypothetical protein